MISENNASYSLTSCIEVKIFTPAFAARLTAYPNIGPQPISAATTMSNTNCHVGWTERRDSRSCRIEL